MIINNVKYEIVATDRNLYILKSGDDFRLYNKANCKFELMGYKALSFDYSTPLLSDELKNYSKEQLTVVKARKDNKNGVLCIHREDGVNVSNISNPIPFEYDLIQITIRGIDLDVNSPKFNGKCVVYVGKDNKRGVYIFVTHNNEKMNSKKIVSYQVPCCFDEVCEYYSTTNEYFRWWKVREEGDLQYFYVRLNYKCGVYNALEGKYEVEPQFDQISPNSYIKGYKAINGRNDYIIIDGEQYISRKSLISKMIMANEQERKAEIKKLLMLEGEKDVHVDIPNGFNKG